MTEEMKASEATRFMVLSLSDVEPVAGPYPVEADARQAAERAALNNPGVEYGIYQKVLVSRAELTVETKGVVG